MIKLQKRYKTTDSNQGEWRVPLFSYYVNEDITWFEKIPINSSMDVLNGGLKTVISLPARKNQILFAMRTQIASIIALNGPQACVAEIRDTCTSRRGMSCSLRPCPNPYLETDASGG